MINSEEINTKQKQYSARDGKIEPHLLKNGIVGLYSNRNSSPWKLMKGDLINITISGDPDYFKSNGCLLWGYYKEDRFNLIDSFYIKNEIEVEFVAPDDGEYKFFLLCSSLEPVIIKYICFY